MTDTLTHTTLPEWDMTPVFPSLSSHEFGSAFDDLVRAIDEAHARFDELNVRKADVSTVDASVVAAFDELAGRLNDVADRAREVNAYVHSFITTDSSNDVAQARNSELQMRFVVMDKLEKRFVAWLGSLDIDALIARSTVASDHEFFVRRAHKRANHQMSEVEEDLVSSLNPSGQGGWAKLHGNVTSRVMVDLQRPDGTRERIPMAQAAGYVSDDPDPALREAAFKAIQSTWPSLEVPLAAALNSIKGWQNEVDRRRGWPDSIEPALFANNVDRAALQAMQEACVESFPDFRRYLKAKARLFGKERLPWWDMNAPLVGSTTHWEWDEAASFVVEQFGTYSERLANLAARAFLERWIDAAPREGKRSGGFCMGLRRDESRILVNFTHGDLSVATVAHELGHAYHNLNLVERTALQRRTPMALAETASTFCETIVTRALLARAGEEERLAILNGELVRDCMIVVAIHSRFLFEKAVYEGRDKRELSARELCELMSEKQLECFGDGIDPDGTHPYMWCVSPHYYSSAYYNWPYTFGLLFGTGLYAQYEKDPDRFRLGYDDLLSSTGSYDAAGLAARFGMDIRSADFWRSSLDVVRKNIDAFEALSR